jgi:AIPR protein
VSKSDVDNVSVEFDRWTVERAAGLPPELDEFEVFAAETIMRDSNLSDEDLLAGIVGRSFDGGCDALYFLLNGKFVRDIGQVPDLRGLTAHLIFVQAKRSDGFSPLQVDRFDALTEDLLDVSKKPEQYRRTYNGRLLRLMEIFKETYNQLIAPRLVIDYYYVTAIDAVEDRDCHASAAHVRETAKRIFPRADIHEFHFINAARLYNLLFDRPLFERRLQCVEIMDGTEGYLALVNLRKFYDFIRGDDGEILERMFDDNVRGFQLQTHVNRSILESLRTPDRTPEFWLLNNGITILCKVADPLPGKVFRIEDPQIVNGLQTSRQIFDYFKADEAFLPQMGSISPNDNRRITVRVIQNVEERTREAIIRATNNQNQMPAEALYTTTRTHKQLERWLQDQELFYERRKGYWRDRRKPLSRIVTPLSIVQALIAIMEARPDDAKGRPRDYINDAEKRYKLFGHDDWDDSKPMDDAVKRLRPYDFEVYLNCWKVLRRVEKFLSLPKLALDNEAQRNLLYYLARYAVCQVVQSAYCPPGKVGAIDVDETFTDDFLRRCLPYVKRVYSRLGGNDEAAKNPKMADAMQKYLKRKLSPSNKTKGANARPTPVPIS